MSQANKGKFLQMKTVFNKKEEDDEISSNENFTFEKECEQKVENQENKKKLELDKYYNFKNTIDMVEVESYKVFNIDIEEESQKTKCTPCVTQCAIY
jgi:hypothetical protein